MREINLRKCEGCGGGRGAANARNARMGNKFCESDSVVYSSCVPDNEPSGFLGIGPGAERDIAGEVKEGARRWKGGQEGEEGKKGTCLTFAYVRVVCFGGFAFFPWFLCLESLLSSCAFSHPHALALLFFP